MKPFSRKLSVIIPNWNGMKYLPACLDALNSQTYNDFDVILVDNGSADQSVAYVKQNYPLVKVHAFPVNKGFAAACNAGVSESGAQYIALLNTDTKPHPDWIRSLVSAIDAASPQVACLASKMLKMSQPDLIDDAGDILTWRGGAFKRGHGQPATKYNKQEEVFAPCAGAALYRRSVMNEIGGFDETFFAYLEDIDLGLRIRLAGYRCLFVPTAQVLHIGHGSAIPHECYIFLVARNRIFIFLKNIPCILIVKHLASLIYGWLFYFLAFSFSRTYLKGTLASLKYMLLMLKKRKRIRKHTRLSLDAIDCALSQDWPEISLGQLSCQWLRHFVRHKK
ncbi:glycosyltransferase family 2 protein [Desulfococcaceae bacterium HSG7]|nr:glycosyltransferase family 2 protein [Desulfococcaceae bacterium HSG7]